MTVCSCKTLRPHIEPIYLANDCVFMQDTALSHRARATQDFFQHVVPGFINAEEWVPDLNPSDYSAWNILQERMYAR